MDDIMILFHKVIVDLMSFNESQFGIFPEAQQQTLRDMFEKQCDKCAVKFFSMLSPHQKKKVAEWACERSTFSKKDLSKGLKKFTKYLDSLSYDVYPPPRKDKK